MQLVVMLSAQRQHKGSCALWHHSTLTVTIRWWGSSAGFHNMRTAVSPTACVLSLTQRRRFGRNIKNSGDSGSLSAPAPFRLITDDAGGGNRRHKVLSRVERSGTAGFGNLGALRAALSGKASASRTNQPRRHSSGIVTTRDCHQNRIHDAQQTTPSGHSYPFCRDSAVSVN